jgi:hypothetical protein
VQVPCDEGVAIRIGPAPCAVAREGIGEASAGVCAGQPLSRESGLFSGADAVLLAEGNTEGRVTASARTTRRGRRPWHAQKLFDREPGGLTVDRSAAAAGPHREGEERAARLAGIPVSAVVFDPSRCASRRWRWSQRSTRPAATGRGPRIPKEASGLRGRL